MDAQYFYVQQSGIFTAFCCHTFGMELPELLSQNQASIAWKSKINAL